MYGQGIFEVLDETAEVHAHTPLEAIELCIDFLIDSETPYLDEEVEAEALEEIVNNYAWRATEISDNCNDGYMWYDRNNIII